MTCKDCIHEKVCSEYEAVPEEKVIENAERLPADVFCQGFMDASIITKQQQIIANIRELILKHTYPGFDKNGKPVSIWNTEGYKELEKLVGASDESANENCL